MHRFKKTLVWLLAAVLLATAFPGQLVRQASAASAATYFIPDVKAIRDTALLTTDYSTSSNQISRSNVYLTNNSKLTIDGTFSYITGSSMGVKVEQLSASKDSANHLIWTTDTTHVTVGAVTQSSGSTNRFSASDLSLYPGFNKITFTGMQGSVQRSDVFYVLYDSIPYIQYIKVLGGSAGAINLNEGTQVVVDNQKITLQGSVQNATKVTLSLNGGTPIVTSLLEDGTFYTPTMSLSSGINSLQFVISNASDSINVSRVLYFYDKNQPFTKLDIQQNSSSDSNSLLNATPTLTEGTTSPGSESAGFIVQMLVPYNAYSDGRGFQGNASYSINGGTPVTITSADETVIPGPDGATPAYRLVSFETDSTAFVFEDDGTVIKSLQNVKFTVSYGSFASTYDAKFNFLPGNVVISKMYYLPNYSGAGDITDESKESLNNVEVPSADFYIMVETEDDIPINPDGSKATTLKGSYLPLSTSPVTLTNVTAATGVEDNQEVYKVSGFSSGVQQVKFNYEGSDSSYTATITYASKSYIYVSNIYDGQTYTFDSRKTGNKLTISGQFIGFNNLVANSAQYFVNGTEITSPPLGVTASSTSFSVTLDILASGPLVYGQNTIVFKGVNVDSAGNKTEITKSLRLYIIDTNVSTIQRFYPTKVPTDGIRQTFDYPDPDTYSDDELGKIYALSTDFTKNSDESYQTSEKSYDLVLRAGGASTLNLYQGSDLFFSLPIPATDKLIKAEANNSFTYNGATYYYDFSGSQDDFMLRIRSIAFNDATSHVYNLELINSTGARTAQKLEIDRVVASYRIVSPQPTVGDQIIVNKNFVHIDIEAEGATSVLIGKDAATKRADLDNRFEYDYIGLKPNKNNAIKIQIVRSSGSISDTINVYYTDAVQVDSEYMEQLSTKHSVFNKGLQLTFPKGTVLKSAQQNGNKITKYYSDTKLLFGIADPTDGVVGRRNDYGNIINHIQSDEDEGRDEVLIPDYLVIRFLSNTNTSNFTRVSQIYWVNGGEGELGDKGTSGYKPATNGLPPYSSEGYFTNFESERKVVPSQRGTLTIAYDPNVVAEAGSTLTVFRYTDSGTWENVGGEVDTKNHTISVPFDDFGYYSVMKLSQSYSDITNHGWARNILNALYAKGIMVNTGSSTFGTDDTTTRGEFATLLVKGLNIPLNYDDKNTFYDVVPASSSATWSYKYIETAARAGIINGLSEGFFSPDGKLTREEAAVMIARALQLQLPTNDTKLETALAKSFLDSANISFYARPAISAVNKAKIMTGATATVTGSTKAFFNFNPKSYMTRAEAGKVAVALLQKSTKIFPSNLS
ncbi:S-layer homology domain-containing protein [Cohnella zeiphila]|uniref:S-layer homology domain-containing protein n=1 Tax=Cohnella zeiphila TaxID=2761120 RepID=A0A7X0SLN6_9BACL|nr:S-layer homology domain-containing protein [Cohnella zeiphila]MBB6732297.1 S-layer homology domain-containing protein [Cohnella zeiphila]